MVSMSDPLVDSTQLDHTERDHDTVPARSGRSAAEDEVVQLCSELIRIDSVNTGDPDTIGDGEARAARYIQAKLEEVGYETVYLEAVPGRGNVICRLAGADPGRGALLVHGHVDVVPAHAPEWTIDPFSGAVQDGYVWGRGAVDMKDMVAMTIAVAREFKRTGYVPPRDLIFAFMSDEEAGGAWGSQWLVEHHPELFTDATEAISEVGGFSITLDDQRRAYLVAALVVERDGNSADLGDRLGGVGEQLGMVLDQPLRPRGAAGLLVRHERENQVPRRYVAGAFELPGHGDRQGHHVLHVHRAAAPDVPVLYGAGERVDSPLRGVRRHHVDVPVDQQRAAPRSGLSTRSPAPYRTGTSGAAARWT